MQRIATFFAGLLAASLPVIFDSALKGTVLLALVGIVVICMRKTSADARHLAWMLGIIGLLFLPLCSAVLPGWRVLPAWAVLPMRARVDERSFESPSPSAAPAHGVSAPTANAPLAIAPSAGAKDPPFAAVPPAVSSASGRGLSHRGPAFWLSAIWISGAALLLGRLVASNLLLHMRSRRAVAIYGGPLQNAIEAVCIQLSLRQRVRLFVDDRGIVPLVWGVFRPRLVLPAEAGEWEPSRLRAVLLHELAHVKRRDVLVMLLTQIACAAHWFNPLVWLAAWRLHIERERACDNLVLTSGVNPADYAEHLLHIATQLETGSPAGALAMARPSRLEGRLMAVLNQQLERGGVTGSIALLAALIGLAIIIPVAMLRAQDKPGISRDDGAVGTGEVIQRSVGTQPPTPGEATTRPIIPAAAEGTVQHATQAGPMGIGWRRDDGDHPEHLPWGRCGLRCRALVARARRSSSADARDFDRQRCVRRIVSHGRWHGRRIRQRFWIASRRDCG
jgi:beta-lactamase regulating signal transducer with metallopeptidase domain